MIPKLRAAAPFLFSICLTIVNGTFPDRESIIIFSVLEKSSEASSTNITSNEVKVCFLTNLMSDLLFYYCYALGQ